MSTTPSRWFAAVTLTAAAALCALAVSGPASAGAPVDRKLTVNITIDGKQDWKNVLQWSKATTTQSYDFSTVLRSDGRLFAPNLLDPDVNTRMAIKTEYLRQQGMARMKAMGVDPKSPNLMQDLSTKAQKASFDCKGESVCMSNTGTKFAELMAAAVEPDNSGLFEGDPRYQYFFGFPTCANTVHAKHEYKAAGETAYGRNKDHIYPYTLTYSGDSHGTPDEIQSMCTLFTVVVDTLENKMYVENVYLPASHGKIVRDEFEKTRIEDNGELPIPGPLQQFVNENMRHSAFMGEVDGVLKLNLPLDGNATVLGNWTGEAKTHLKWAWTDLAGNPVGPVATSAPPKPAAPAAAAAKPAAAKPAPAKSAPKAPAAKAPAKTPAKTPAPKPAVPDDSGLPPAANQK
jgi:hypothetical protein